MECGIVGLGKMGGRLAEQAIEKGHRVIGHNRSPQKTDQLKAKGLEGAYSLEELCSKLSSPRVILLYVPTGEATDEVCEELYGLLEPGDLVADGGNAFWEDSKRRYQLFGEKSVRFLDLGTSGGLSGARTGACFMVGGDREAYLVIEPLLKDLAVDPQGVIYLGSSGSGHFAKLVHNGIEFGMVQSIAEGVDLLSRSEFKLDLPALFETWGHGSVIRSWLVELMATALREHRLEEIGTGVQDSGEVKKMLEWALTEEIPTPVIATAQFMRIQYRERDPAAAKSVALLRNQFGGHPLPARER